jgi:fatty acid CoA ligase FadD36
MVVGRALLPALQGVYGDHADAVTVAGRSMSWEALRGAATAVADRLAGAPAVAIRASASLDTVVATVGALLAGVPAVPVPADAGPIERDHILRDSGAVTVLDGVDLDARSDTALPEPDGDATALVLYTSGTTGAPKGVMISRDALAADLDALAEAWAWTPADLLVHGLPLYHVHGLVLGQLGPLRLGCRVVHTGRPSPESYARARGTLYFGVPTVWSRIAGDPAAAVALRAARLLVSGSAALPAPVFDALRELTGHEPVERYGMTETLITVSTRAGGPRRPGSVGTRLRGVDTRVVDDDGAPTGDIGELQVRGNTLFQGYLNRPDATAESFTADGWLRTGDAAVLSPDGSHRIVGRATSDLIKTGGFRVGAGEVEDALLTHPAVREAAVVGEPDDDLGQVITAYVVGDPVGADDLTAFVAERLSVHKRPRRVRFVESLPRNALGKVQKNRLS